MVQFKVGCFSIADHFHDAGRFDGIIEKEVLVRRVAIGDGLDDLLSQNTTDDCRH